MRAWGACGEDQLATTVPKRDQRAERTRRALMSAFNRLVLDRGYDAITPGDVAEAAGVARSTLYEHFAGKEDILRHSLLPILDPLAACGFSPVVPPRLIFTLEHIRESRRMARELLGGRARMVAMRTLSQLIGSQLPRPSKHSKDIPVALKAAYLASAILSLIDEWLSGREPCSIPVLARNLRAMTHAAASAESGDLHFG